MTLKCLCVSLVPNLGVSVILGGEVNPLEHGHEDRGGFANGIMVLDEGMGALIELIAPNEF